MTLWTTGTIYYYQAYAISAIAHWDWPEAWPDLFGHLMQALTSGDGNLVHGAMRVLTGIKSTLWYLDTIEVLFNILCFVNMAKRIPGLKIPLDRIKRDVKIVLLRLVTENWQSQGKTFILFAFCCWTNTKSLLVTWICFSQSSAVRWQTSRYHMLLQWFFLKCTRYSFMQRYWQCIHGYHVMCLIVCKWWNKEL